MINYGLKKAGQAAPSSRIASESIGKYYVKQ
jgi:hypothetical protein